jgi:hypothetical protein
MTELRLLAEKNSSIFWDIKSISHLSDAAIVERIINYGDYESFQEIFSVLDMNNFYAIFSQLTNKDRNNLRPEAENLARIYANKRYGQSK